MMIKQYRSMLIAVGAIVGFSTYAFAQQSTTGSSDNSARASQADQQFLIAATQSSLAEIRTSQIALQKSKDPMVCKFAMKMIDDHSKANALIATLAASNTVTLPTDVDTQHANAAAQLATLPRKEFDRQYLMQQVQDHQAAVALFSTESTSGQEAAIKTAAAITLPQLQDHLMMVQQLANEHTRR